LPHILACQADDFSEETVKIVEVRGIEIGIFRKAGSYYAYRNVCPHQGGPVCEGMQIPKVITELSQDKTFRKNNFATEEMHIVCPWHGWEFKLDTGEAMGNPAIRLRRYDVVERDGKIYLDV
jgi:nitrite reductase (NADH) small subunit